jgi:transglutaminase-like putative cysteine protease
MSEMTPSPSTPELEPAARGVYEAWEATFGMTREERTAEVESLLARNAAFDLEIAEIIRWVYCPHEFTTPPAAVSNFKVEGDYLVNTSSGLLVRVESVAPASRQYTTEDRLHLEEAYGAWFEEQPTVQRLRACGAESRIGSERPLTEAERTVAVNGLRAQLFGSYVHTHDPQLRRQMRAIEQIYKLDQRVELASVHTTQTREVTPAERVKQLLMQAYADHNGGRLPIGIRRESQYGSKYVVDLPDGSSALSTHFQLVDSLCTDTEMLSPVLQHCMRAIAGGMLQAVFLNGEGNTAKDYNHALDKQLVYSRRSVAGQVWLSAAHEFVLELPLNTYIRPQPIANQNGQPTKFLAEKRPTFVSKEEDERDKLDVVAEIYAPGVEDAAYFSYQTDNPDFLKRAELLALDGIGDVTARFRDDRPQALYGFELIGKDREGHFVYRYERPRAEPHVAVDRAQLATFFRGNPALKFLAKGIPSEKDQPQFGIRELASYLRSHTSYYMPQATKEAERSVAKAAYAGVIVRGKHLYAQCSGSSELLRDALQAIGISAQTVGGYKVEVTGGDGVVTANMAHARVEVQIDGEGYHFDATAGESMHRPVGFLRRLAARAGQLATGARGKVIRGMDFAELNAEDGDMTTTHAISTQRESLAVLEEPATPQQQLRENLANMERTLTSAHGMPDVRALYDELRREYLGSVERVNDPLIFALSIVARTVPVTLGAPLPTQAEFDMVLDAIEGHTARVPHSNSNGFLTAYVRRAQRLMQELERQTTNT